MRRTAIILGTSVGLSVAVLALVLSALSISLARWDGVAFYAAVSLVAFAGVTWLLRLHRREQREREALLPPEQRPARRVPRQPIRLPLGAAVPTFFGWYTAALVTSYLANGRLFWFDLAVVGPFAAFLLSILTFAGRHIAFRLTAEEASAGTARDRRVLLPGSASRRREAPESGARADDGRMSEAITAEEAEDEAARRGGAA